MDIQRKADLMVQLEQAGRFRQQCREARDLAGERDELELIREMAREAVAGGMSKSEVARLAGISRPTLYKLLADRPSRSTSSSR